MIKKLTLGTLVLLVFVFSCKKDDTELEEQPAETVPLIISRAITYPQYEDIDSTYYFYDDQGKTTGYKDNYNQQTEVTYSGSTVVYTSYDEELPDYTETYTLNEQKMAAQMVRSISGGTNSNQKFYYNSNKQLTKAVTTFTGRSDTTLYFYDGDNIAKYVTRHVENATVTSDTTSFEYYLDKVSTLNPANYGAPFLGVKSKNLIKKKKMGVVTREYIYEFDSQNRVIKETSKDGAFVTYNISYKYKD